MPGFQSPVHSDFPFLHNLYFLYDARIWSNPIPDGKQFYNQLIINYLK